MTENNSSSSEGYIVVPDSKTTADLDHRTPAESETVSVVLDSEGCFTSWNPAAEALTGWSAPNILDEPVAVLYGDNLTTETDLDEQFETARENGYVEVKGWCERSDGTQFWSSLTVTPRQRENGSPTDYTLVIRDETHQKQIEKERWLLADVSRNVAESDSFEDGVESALAAVCNHTQWSYGEAWTPNSEDKTLEHVAGHAEDEELDAFLHESKPVTFAVGEGLPGRVFESGSPEWIPDVTSAKKKIFHRTTIAEDVGLRAAFGVPVTSDERIVAVLTFFLQERREADESLVHVVTDVAADLGGLMSRRQTEEALAMERTLLDRTFQTSPVGLLVTDTDGTIQRANDQVSAILGESTESLLGRSSDQLTGTFRTVDGNHVSPAELPITRTIETGEPVENVELEFVPDKGAAKWISVSTASSEVDDGSGKRITVTIEDITERKEREQSLRTFRKAIEHAGHTIYITDIDGIIQYVNPAFETTTGYETAEAIGQTPEILNSGEHDEQFFDDLWTTIQNGNVWQGEVTNERKGGEQYVVNQTIAPIVDETGSIERYVAVNDEITDQKRRERTLRRQRNSLERIQQIIDSLRPINRQLVRAHTREEIDSVVCEPLASSDAYLFAWLGDYNQATEHIAPREWAGVENQFVGDLDFTDAASDPEVELCEQALTKKDVSVLQDVPTDPAFQDKRERALTYGFQSIAAVPIMYGETVLGVVGAYSARPNAFDKYEQSLLRELGERIGHAINAAENRQLLHTDTVVELEFEVGSADSALVHTTEELDCQLSVNNVTPTTDIEYLCYVEVDGEKPGTVVELVASMDAVSHARVVRAHGKFGLIEITLGSGPLPRLLRHGATVQSFTAAKGEGKLVARTAPQSDVQDIVTDMEATNEATVFLAKRTRIQEAATLKMTRKAVDDTVTERQQEVLSLAYYAGYFESPRDSNGEELASALGIASPTFYQHVRKGVREIVGLLTEADEYENTPTLEQVEE